MSITVVLLGTILTFVLASMATFERTATGGIRRLENLDEARTLMAVISKDVRTAAKLDASTPPFVTSTGSSGRCPGVASGSLCADENQVTFYANLNLSTSCPKIIHLYVNANKELIEEVTQPTSGTPPTCTYPAVGSGTTRRLVGQYVANTLTNPTDSLFTYYYTDAGGDLAGFCRSASAPGCSAIGDQTPLTSANGLLVQAVGINLEIRKSTVLPVALTTLVNRVRLPNVYYNPPPSPSP
jgi:hypothetical protein